MFDSIKWNDVIQFEWSVEELNLGLIAITLLIFLQIFYDLYIIRLEFTASSSIFYFSHNAHALRKRSITRIGKKAFFFFNSFANCKQFFFHLFANEFTIRKGSAYGRWIRHRPMAKNGGIISQLNFVLNCIEVISLYLKI